MRQMCQDVLSLLQAGRFVFIRHGFETLSQAQSKSLFRTARRVPTVHEVHANWKSSLASSFATRTRDKDAIIILTRRTLNHLNGDDANGFSVKGGICTADNISLVKDDGVFGVVNLLVKIFLHAAGVDFDGFGAAIGCPANQGYLMGGKKLHLPLQFSRCSMSLVHAALRQLKCIKSRMGSKAGHAIPMPPKMSRDAYCSALGSRSCDDRGMDKLEHKRPEKYECFVYCCKGFYNMFQKVAPDGLKCGDDCFNYKDKVNVPMVVEASHPGNPAKRKAVPSMPENVQAKAKSEIREMLNSICFEIQKINERLSAVDQRLLVVDKKIDAQNVKIRCLENRMPEIVPKVQEMDIR
ncbi:uncharacterized protein LOC119459144 [Dermacentor silvarum]|uniref:uncharacterized protein LOC119459144 n=1 Tax=Dermacentor silvarum TaxID=543639 RepID=UPI00210161B3|nr:uncharacterized protein LOC119459144 [Dermacentor silvarum]